MNLADLSKHRETCKIKVIHKFQLPANRIVPEEYNVLS